MNINSLIRLTAAPSLGLGLRFITTACWRMRMMFNFSRCPNSALGAWKTHLLLASTVHTGAPTVQAQLALGTRISRRRRRQVLIGINAHGFRHPAGPLFDFGLGQKVLVGTGRGSAAEMRRHWLGGISGSWSVLKMLWWGASMATKTHAGKQLKI